MFSAPKIQGVPERHHNGWRYKDRVAPQTSESLGYIGVCRLGHACHLQEHGQSEGMKACEQNGNGQSGWVTPSSFSLTE